MSNPSNPYGYNGEYDPEQKPQEPQSEGHNSTYAIPPQQSGYPQSPYTGPTSAPVAGQTPMVATMPSAASLSYWAIGLAGFTAFLGLISAFFFLLPVFVMPFSAIPGMVIARKSKKIQPNQMSTIAFWVNLVGLFISVVLIIIIMLIAGLLLASGSY